MKKAYLASCVLLLAFTSVAAAQAHNWLQSCTGTPLSTHLLREGNPGKVERDRLGKRRAGVFFWRSRPVCSVRVWA
jgi:hypothetical protein